MSRPSRIEVWDPAIGEYITLYKMRQLMTNDDGIYQTLKHSGNAIINGAFRLDSDNDHIPDNVIFAANGNAVCSLIKGTEGAGYELRINGTNLVGSNQFAYIETEYMQLPMANGYNACYYFSFDLKVSDLTNKVSVEAIYSVNGVHGEPPVTLCTMQYRYRLANTYYKVIVGVDYANATRPYLKLRVKLHNEGNKIIFLRNLMLSQSPPAITPLTTITLPIALSSTTSATWVDIGSPINIVFPYYAFFRVSFITQAFVYASGEATASVRGRINSTDGHDVFTNELSTTATIPVRTLLQTQAELIPAKSCYDKYDTIRFGLQAKTGGTGTAHCGKDAIGFIVPILMT